MSEPITADFDQDSPPEPMPKSIKLDPRMSESVGFTPPPPQADPDEEVDVDPAAAMAEARDSEDPVSSSDEPEEKEDVLDILKPKAEPRIWKIGQDDLVFELMQKPLSFVHKMEWFALVGDALDKAMAGENGVSINELLSTPGTRGQQLQLSDLRDADNFVRAMAKLVSAAPDFIMRSYCIWLNVPDGQRRIASHVMALPEDEGGLSDDQGLEIIEVFIDQNFDALSDFFGGKVGRLVQRVQARQSDRKARLARG